MWDAATGKSLATLAGHEGDVSSAQFSPDGARIVTASDDKTARVWDAATGKSLATLAGHESDVWSAQFSPDGARIVTASTTRPRASGRILPPTAGPPPAWFADFLRYMAQMRLNSDGELETLKPDGLARAARANARGAARERGAGHALPPHPPPLRARVGAHGAVKIAGGRSNPSTQWRWLMRIHAHPVAVAAAIFQSHRIASTTTLPW